MELYNPKSVFMDNIYCQKDTREESKIFLVII